MIWQERITIIKMSSKGANSRILSIFRSNIINMGKLIKNGFAHIFVGTFLNKAVTMISSIVIARIVNKAEYAYLGYSETIYGYILLFAGMGLSNALLKVCSGETDSSKDKAYLLYAVKCGIISASSITILTVFVCMLVNLPFPQAKGYIIATMLYPALYFLYDVMMCYIRTKQKNKLYAGVNFLNAVLTCIFSIIFVLGLDAVGVVFARYVVLIIVGSIILSEIKKILTTNHIYKLCTEEKRQLWVMAISLVFASAFASMMPFNENLLISNIIGNEEIAANFRVAGLFPQMILLVSQAVTIYFFPIIASLDNKGEKTRTKIIKIELLNVILVIGVMLVGIVISPWLIGFFYGEKYVDAIPLTYMLWIMRGITAAVIMVPSNMLIAIGKIKFNLIISIVTFVLQITFDWLFIINYGINGVAYGTILTYVIVGIAYWVYFFRVTRDQKNRKY